MQIANKTNAVDHFPAPQSIQNFIKPIGGNVSKTSEESKMPIITGPKSVQKLN